MEKKQLSLAALHKAIDSLKLALKHPPANDLERDGVIQRFEYTFELTWKILRKYLISQEGLAELNLKDIFREAGRRSLIENVERWFEFLESRNLASHTYNELNALEAYKNAQLFLPEAVKLIEQLTKRISHD